MPTVAQLNDTVFRDSITRAVQDVFKTMLGQQAALVDATIPPLGHAQSPDANGPQVVGTVGFIGEISGLIYLHLGVGFASVVAEQLLGMTSAELAEAGDEVVNDAVGELTNMTVGAFKNQLCDLGYPCKLTIPSILRGSNFHIEPVSSATRRVFRFQIGKEILIADLLMKQGD